MADRETDDAEDTPHPVATPPTNYTTHKYNPVGVVWAGRGRFLTRSDCPKYNPVTSSIRSTSFEREPEKEFVHEAMA